MNTDYQYQLESRSLTGQGRTEKVASEFHPSKLGVSSEETLTFIGGKFQFVLLAARSGFWGATERLRGVLRIGSAATAEPTRGVQEPDASQKRSRSVVWGCQEGFS